MGSRISAGQFTTAEKEKWVVNFARLGIMSKGFVYLLIGILTSMAAFGFSGQKANKAEALAVLHQQPFGKLLLILVGIGLLGYVTWRFYQSFADIDHQGNATRAKAIRIGYGISGLLYLSFAFLALKLALQGDSGNGDSQELLVGKVLSYPGGEWIIGIIGLIILGNGIRQGFKAITGSFMKDVNLINSSHFRLFKRTGTAGYFARGIVLVIIGYFFIRAAISSNANEAEGTKEAFSFLENNFGTLLMGLVAVGLALYGVFMFVKGRWQKIDLNF